MAQLQQKTYPFDIPSISDMHPGIPANMVHNLRLDENIATGDPINIINATRAQGIATVLAQHQVLGQAIADEVIETATNRATVIRSTHGQLEFSQGGNAAILALLNTLNNTLNVMNITINGLDRRLLRTEVVIENARTVKRNQQLRSLGPGQVYISRRKEVIGSGTALAQQIHGGIALPPNVDISPPADVGTAPASLNPFTATGNDILRLISFYNDTFGVISTDNLAARQEKLFHWLTESFF